MEAAFCILSKIALPLATLLVSALALLVVYSQMRIASAKVQLDLYNRRFSIYESALELYTALFNQGQQDINPLRTKFMRSVRESRFLFDEKDGVYAALEIIRKNCDMVNDFTEARKTDAEQNRSEEQKEYLRLLGNRCTTATMELEGNLLVLETKMGRYLDFNTVDGWGFWRK